MLLCDCFLALSVKLCQFIKRPSKNATLRFLLVRLCVCSSVCHRLVTSPATAKSKSKSKSSRKKRTCKQLYPIPILFLLLLLSKTLYNRTRKRTNPWILLANLIDDINYSETFTIAKLNKLKLQKSDIGLLFTWTQPNTECFNMKLTEYRLTYDFFT